ncbi:MAG TPA: DNA polymerase III subunit delta [Phototrophicaceae bacterium]|nr:DNA polymerase III subunit delta [Phototrophicaceae bacterium]
MSKAAKTVYILHGDDDFSLGQEVTSLRAKMGDDLNTSEFDGQTASAPEVLNAVCSYPFLSDKRLVMVKGMLAWITRKGAGETGKKMVEQLTQALPNLPEWARLVFIERGTLAESNRVLKLVKELPNGYEKAFAAPKDATGWILKQAREVYGVEIQPAAAVALATVTQNDLFRADNELVKLASYVGPEHPITEDDVALLTPYVAETKVFDMVDAMAEGRAEPALKMLHQLLDEQDEDPFRLYGMIVRQFRLLLTAKEYLALGGSPGQMADALKIHKFVAQKLSQQSRALALPQLEKIYRTLLETDIRMKTGRIEPALALDLLVAGLAK